MKSEKSEIRKINMANGNKYQAFWPPLAHDRENEVVFLKLMDLHEGTVRIRKEFISEMVSMPIDSMLISHPDARDFYSRVLEPVNENKDD